MTTLKDMKNGKGTYTPKGKTVGEEQSGREAARATDQRRNEINGLDSILAATPKKGGASASAPTAWVGKVTHIEERTPQTVSFIKEVPGSHYIRAMIKSLVKAIADGNGSHTFNSVSEVEYFDAETIADAWAWDMGHTIYDTDKGKAVINEAKMKRDNNRMGHAWGLALLGQCSYLEASNSKAMQVWVANNCDADGKLALFRVAKVVKK